MDSPISFTGRSRRKRGTRLSVRFGEIASRFFITVGGIGTIVAVLTIFVFLVWMVVPLFRGAQVNESSTASPEWAGKRPARVEIDEYRQLGWALFSDGVLQVFRMDNGQQLGRQKLFPESTVSAISMPVGSGLALGFADGKVRLGRIRSESRFLTDNEVTPPVRELAPGGVMEFEGGVVSRAIEGQYRQQKFKPEFEDAIDARGEPSAVVLIDRADGPRGNIVGTLTADGKFRVDVVTKRRNEITDEEIVEVSGGEVPLPTREGKPQPSHLLISGIGDYAFIIWADGHLVRVNIRNPEEPKIVEEIDLLSGRDQAVTAVQFLLGRTSFLVGDSTGHVRVWFPVNKPDASTKDGVALVAAHDLPGPPAAVTALASSERTRLIAAGYADGQVRLLYVTSEKQLAVVPTRSETLVQGLAFAPKEDGFLAISPAGVWTWDLNAGYPEATPRSLFLPVWYEDYPAPAQVWQSTGSEGYEPKFGFWPLVFGTLKATFYSLLIAVPLALMAAIYTSEFLEPKAKTIVKPAIEMMAGLPSVVLGFLAAFVFAPFVSRHLAAVLTGLVAVPLTVLLAAYVWQFIPEKPAVRLGRRRFVFLGATMVVGFAVAALAGPVLEGWLFDGDLKGWLAGQHGSARTGWFVILFPLGCAGVSWAFAQFVSPWVRRVTNGKPREVVAGADIGRFAAVLATGALAAALVGAALTGLGFDPRGSLVGTYIERNALIVGFAMGFAVIPIIYTLSEDALSAVPEHLRAASLGCGATPWQTAYRIIIPSAMSGLFSAVMIGLGRAVGETMIVLMAAGNTPVLELNIFNGFRTLAANIAVEMPEAVKGGTHYRTLFLAALMLFAITFVVNTAAEAVRQRFRKRAYQL